jgi:cytochrome c oxidase assembly protein subunit 11
MGGDRWLVAKLAALALGMFAFGFALAPLYGAMCRLLGVGSPAALAGAAVVAEDPDPSRLVTVDFVTSASEGSPWEFAPSEPSMTVHPGELYSATFHARNRTAGALVAQAVPSIVPGAAARYFRKTECFCFTPQSFAAGEGRELTVRFLVDRALPAHVEAITLAYTLFDVTETAGAPERVAGRWDLRD